MQRELETDLKIDRFALEREAETLADTYRYWAEQAAQARADADAAKDRLQLTEAEVGLEIRSSAEKKPTEATVEAMVVTDKRVIRARNEFVEAKRNSAILDGAVRAIDHKRSQLDNLVKLWIAGYYADGRTSSRDDQIADAGARALNRNRNRNRNTEE